MDMAFRGGTLGGLLGAASYGAIVGLGALGQGIDNLAANMMQNSGNSWTRILGNTIEISAADGFTWVGGFDLPSGIIPNVAMRINGALAGNWGRKLIPASTWERSTYNIHEKLSGNTSDLISQKYIRQNYGDITKKFRSVQLGLNGINGDYIEISSFGCGLDEIYGGDLGYEGLALSKHVETNPYNYRRTASMINTGYQRYVFHGIRLSVFRRYGIDIPNPWWRRIFFGVGR